ncbi:MFS transporter [Streptomyces sp. NPDC046876]|uniref:MFS transporter n=1 Tax=Streptomyces sp. NPDC046876 TaxID=3155616 RepID=UPI0033F35833
MTPQFGRLLAAHTASQFGFRIAQTAFPLTALAACGASAAQAAALMAVQTAGFLLVGLPAGSWVDRCRKVPVMVAADGVRCATALCVAMAWAAGRLELGLLYAAAFAVGVAAVFFDVAAQSAVPALLPTRDLVRGNARLSAAESTAAVLGPVLAGTLAWHAAPLGFAVSTLGYAVSAAFLLLTLKPPHIQPRRRLRRTGSGAQPQTLQPRRRLRREGSGAQPQTLQPRRRLRREGSGAQPRDTEKGRGGEKLRAAAPNPSPAAARAGVWRDVAEGLRFVAAHPALRRIAAATGLFNAAWSAAAALLIPLMLAHGLSRTAAGAVMAALGAGGLAGSFTVRRLAQRLGAGRSITVGLMLPAPFALLAGFTGRVPVWATAVALFGVGAGAVVYNVAQISLRQSVTPPGLLGRVNATLRTLVWGMIPLGAALASAATRVADPAAVVLVGGCAAACAWVLLLRLPGSRTESPEIPEIPESTESPERGADPSVGDTTEDAVAASSR